jgi:hypothetical protein
MLPTNMFDGRRRTTKSFRLVPIHVGVLPESLFSPQSNTFCEEQFINDIGNSQLKLFVLEMHRARFIFPTNSLKRFRNSSKEIIVCQIKGSQCHHM